MKTFPLTVEHFFLIKTIAKFQSFKKAAKELGLSQSGITLRIQKLEKNLKIKIFTRDQKVSLTAAGYILYKYGEKIVFLYQEAYTLLKSVRNQTTSMSQEFLKIGASQTIGTYLMPQILGLFKKQYPNINVQLEVQSTRRICWCVANGQLDFAIVGGEIPEKLQGALEIIPYAEDELALILPIYHPLSSHKEIKKEELYRLNFITLNSNSTIQKAIDKILQSNGIDTKQLIIEMELNTIEGIKNAVESGLGAAFISVSAIKRELQLKSLHGIKVKGLCIKRQLSIVVHPNRYKKKIQKTFEIELSSLFGKLPIEKKYLINNFIDN